MLPRLTRQGVLPPGVHRAALPEVLVRFGGGSRRRVRLAQRLQQILSLAQRGGRLCRVLLWGSYVTAKAEPNDVDVMLVMAADFLVEQCDPEARPVFDPGATEAGLNATVVWVRDDLPAELLDAFVDQWQIGRDGTPRGIVEVIL